MDCCSVNNYNIDWVATSALGVAIISVVIGILFNRKTLRLTEAHNKKTVEPLITDFYTFLAIKEIGKSSSISYQIKNSGLGPAIITSLNFSYNGINYAHALDIYNLNIGKSKYDTDTTSTFTLEQTQILSPNESLSLFEFYFKDLESAIEFHVLVKKFTFTLEYETIYGEKRSFKKERLSTI